MKPMLLTASLALGFAPVCALAAKEDWYTEVIQVMVDGEPLNTADGRPSRDGLWFEAEAMGHAAPVYYDWDRDGNRDLLVGGFSGRFRVYRNEGEDAAPVFSGYDWVRAGDDIALLHNFCCIATGIRMADIDGDGRDDLTAGHYLPGYIFWFQGRQDGFAPRQMLTDYTGLPVLTGLDTVTEEIDNSLSAKPTWMDWDDDGALDLIIGDYSGKLVLRRNRQLRVGDGLTPIPGQPVYDEFEGQLSVFDHVQGGGGALAEDNFLSPTVADWDGDGLSDLVVGAGSGAVYWLRNIGEVGEPAFAAPKRLLPGLPDNAYPPMQLLEGEREPTRGARSSVDVADWNGDGKLDLLVGDWAQAFRLRGDLTGQERQAFERLKAQLVNLDRRAGIEGPPEPFRDRLKGTRVYTKDFRSALSKEKRALEAELIRFFEVSRPEYEGSRLGRSFFYGHVWVYLRK